MNPLPKRKKRSSQPITRRFVIIGGGIAGVSCALELSHAEDCDVTLIAETPTLKESRGTLRVTKRLEEFAVFERSADSFCVDNPRIHVIVSKVSSISYAERSVNLQDNRKVHFDKLCLCTGASPRVLGNHANIFGLRDLESVEYFSSKLRGARRVAILGNGGIALELVHELRFCDVDWVIRDKYIGSAIFDSTSSAFIMPELSTRAAAERSEEVARLPKDESGLESNGKDPDPEPILSYKGQGLGPDWMKLAGVDKTVGGIAQGGGRLKIHFEQEILAVRSAGSASWEPAGGALSDQTLMPPIEMEEERDVSYPLYLLTTKNEIIGCDFVVSAIGVIPNIIPFTDLVVELDSKDGAYVVDRFMRLQTVVSTTANQISLAPVDYCFAAGDCCFFLPGACEDLREKYILSDGGDDQSSEVHWHQMRLWTQARSMGSFAAQCMLSPNLRTDPPTGGLFFDLFAHLTRFFGYKVVLLGRYNAQGLCNIGNAEEKVKTITVTEDGLRFEEKEHDSKYIETDELHSRETDLQVWCRVTTGVEYVKVIVYRGKVVGALLVGDTGLEETLENLIMNRTDVSRVGVALLDPGVDIEDYFD